MKIQKFGQKDNIADKKKKFRIQIENKNRLGDLFSLE
jgi:hypothetical protein